MFSRISSTIFDSAKNWYWILFRNFAHGKVSTALIYFVWNSNIKLNFLISVNPFLAIVFISYFLKPPENVWFSVIFRKYKMRKMVRNGLHMAFDNGRHSSEVSLKCAFRIFIRFGRFSGFNEFDGFSRFDGFSGFDRWPRLSLKGFSISFTVLLKVLYLLLSYLMSYTWLLPRVAIASV